ncbi:MAG TPA: hypothetical protein VG944_07555, partial [Fimbriimonas sp.]|nr:hypothetical protein [Fimbriimonas sp.]
QPWHHPSFFYSRRRDRFYSLERALYALDGGNGAVTGWMELQAPCTFLTSARFFGKSRPGLHVSSAESGNFNDRAIAIDLRWLERRLTPESLSTDARDRELLRRERMAER